MVVCLAYVDNMLNRKVLGTETTHIYIYIYISLTLISVVCVYVCWDKYYCTHNNCVYLYTYIRCMLCQGLGMRIRGTWLVWIGGIYCCCCCVFVWSFSTYWLYAQRVLCSVVDVVEMILLGVSIDPCSPKTHHLNDW